MLLLQKRGQRKTHTDWQLSMSSIEVVKSESRQLGLVVALAVRRV